MIGPLTLPTSKTTVALAATCVTHGAMLASGTATQAAS